MLSETNKTVSRRFLEEVWNKRNMAVLNEIIANDHVNSGPGTLPGLPTGPEGAKQFVMMYRNAFPDTHFTIDEQIAEGEGLLENKIGLLGHGLGLDIHDIPDFYYDESALSPGEVITVEPCLLLEGVGGGWASYQEIRSAVLAFREAVAGADPRGSLADRARRVAAFADGIASLAGWRS